MSRLLDISKWTYGAEHEWADWPLDRPLPNGYGIDTRDITMVNSTGVAVDPKGKLHRFGGEFNTPPTDTIEGQVACLEELRALYPEATVNYRSNLHLHIRVPGLKDDLRALKLAQSFIHYWMPLALPTIEPIPTPRAEDYNSPEEYRGARRRFTRRKVSHHTLLKPERLRRQLDADTVERFLAAEVPHTKDGRPQWHLQPRLCVNLRQMRETDTIEFRHWPGTLDPAELRLAFDWCEQFLERALSPGANCFALTACYSSKEIQASLPRFAPYDHWLEERYRRTVHDGTIPREQLPINIAQVLKETRS